MTRFIYRALICLSLVVFFTACAEELTGPEPQMGGSSGEPGDPDDLVTDPGFACNEDPGTWITLTGEDFSPLVFDAIATESDHDVELPTVRLTLRTDPTGGSTDESFSIELSSIPGAEDGQIRWIDGQTLQFRISDDLELPPGVYDVQVINPNGESVIETEAFGILPRPSLNEAIPERTCVAQGEREVVLLGDDILILDDHYATIEVGGQSVEVVDIADCQDLHAVFGGHQLCREATVVVDEGAFEPGTYPVTVENFDPAGCASDPDADGVTLTIVPPPTVTAVAPRAFCSSDDSVIIDIDGEDFFEVDGEAPTVAIGESTYVASGVDCADVEGEEGVRSCEALEVEIDPSDLAGVTTLTVINPEPIGCESADSEEFYAVPEVQISEADPDGFCEDASFDGEVTLYGPFVYDTAGDLPVVTVDGTEVAIDQLFGCEVVIDGLTVESCEGLDITVPVELAEEDFSITVSTSDPLACGEDTVVLERTSPPTIDAVIPGRVCADGGTTLEVLGSNIHENAEFTLDGQPATSATVAADGSSATVTFNDPLVGTLATFEVINPGDCGSAYSEELRITDGPLPVFVDPPVVYDDMNTQVTIYAAGLYGGTVDEVELIHPDGTTTVLDHSYDASRPAVIQATIPAGTLASVDEGDLNEDGTADFGIRLTDQEITCSNEAHDLVTITSELSLALSDINPPFGAQDQSTGVTISAVDAADLEADEVQMEATPRAYLNPVSGDADSLAREIRAIQFISPTEINGIVPSGLTVGFYDVIVVNPDGQVGTLEGAFQVTEERPPLIDSVSPGSWTTGEAALGVDIEGQNFRDLPGDPTVEVFCRPSGSTETDESQLHQPASITIVNVTDTLVETSVNTDGLGHLDVCYMRLTNADGTYAEYSPITVTNPAGNFVEFQAGADFDTARRGLTLLSGVPSRAARYLYVLGGDDGALSGVHSSGEFARVNRFGEPLQWDYLPYDLPAGRTLANGVRIDDFLYLVGGHDGAEVSDEVLRAQVLDPLDAPEIVALDIEVEQFLEGDGQVSGGLDAGTYYYRVSAVYSSNDPANPGGESLASEPQPVSLPMDGVELTISWTPPEQINHDIAYYRVYRSIAADDPYGDESLIYETTDASETSFADDGSIAPVAGDNPLSIGSLGMWHSVATLNAGRMVAGITSAQNPADASEHFIYAVGGEDDAGEFRADYEFVSVSVAGPRDQAVSDAVIGQFEEEDMLLPSPRGELQAITASESNASSLDGQAPQIFLLGGQSDGTDSNQAVFVAGVNADGHLDDWTQLPTQQNAHYAAMGHAAAVFNNELIIGGGDGGNPSERTAHTSIVCGAGCPPPSVANNWTPMADAGGEERVWMGHIAFRGFWYLAGGLTTGNTPTNSIDYSVAGGAP